MRAALPMLPRGAARDGWPTATGVAPDSEAAMVVVDRGQDDYVLAVGAAGGDVGRALVHVKEAFAEQVAEPVVPAADLAALTKLETERQAHRDAGQDGARRARRQRRRRRRGDRRGEGLRGDGRSARSPSWSTRRSPTTQAVWAKFVGGEGKAMGALVGAVMKASKGKADGKAVTALLNARKG